MSQNKIKYTFFILTVFILIFINSCGTAKVSQNIPQTIISGTGIEYNKNYLSSDKEVKQRVGTFQDQERIFLPILVYHYIDNISDPKNLARTHLSTSTNTFEEEIKAIIAQNYKTYFINDIAYILNGSKEYKNDGIILTFDDGYEDFYTRAFPILKKYNIKATLYIVSDFIDKKDYLTQNQVKEIIDSGLVEIGSHTLDHKNLEYLTRSESEEEILKSKNDLEKTYHIKINSFAYPYGGYKPITQEIVKNSGYTIAVSNKAGGYQDKSNIYKLYRIGSDTIRQEMNEKNIIEIINKFKEIN